MSQISLIRDIRKNLEKSRLHLHSKEEVTDLSEIIADSHQKKSAKRITVRLFATGIHVQVKAERTFSFARCSSFLIICKPFSVSYQRTFPSQWWSTQNPRVNPLSCYIEVRVGTPDYSFKCQKRVPAQLLFCYAMLLHNCFRLPHL